MFPINLDLKQGLDGQKHDFEGQKQGLHGQKQELAEDKQGLSWQKQGTLISFHPFSVLYFFSSKPEQKLYIIQVSSYKGIC